MSYSRWLYLASLVTFSFGALIFPVLVATYWKERRARRLVGGRLVFPFFTLACAAAFLANVALLAAARAGQAWTTLWSLVLSLATGLLPPLMVHVICAGEEAALPARRAWRQLLTAFYLFAAVTAVLSGLSNAELLGAGWSDWLDAAAPARLGCAGIAGLLLQLLSRRQLAAAARRQRWWNCAILALMLVCAVAQWSFLADYLLLAFFCVTLYYTERLAFFDLLMKRAVLFGLCLAALTLWFALVPLDRVSEEWSRPWIAALLLTPFWLAAPWIYARLTRMIDRVFLGRRYSPVEAERRFLQAVEAALTEDDLRSRAEESLGDIFQAPAEVRFDTGPALGAELSAAFDRQHGSVALRARPGGVPFLSDDRRLLQSLARTLDVVLENTRFRRQRQRHEERERELRWLASRAELKALRAQINPHFLFNALNAIAGLIPDDPRLAEETVERLAEVFRYTLRKSEKEWVRLDEELEFVAAYLEVERARFGDRLHVEFDVAAPAGAALVPAMSVQPLVENAVKHGLSQIAGRGTLTVRAAVEDAALHIEVFDNGLGFPPGFDLAQAGAGHGLRNVADRLQGYYDDAARLAWDRTGDLTRVELRIPSRPASQNRTATE